MKNIAEPRGRPPPKVDLGPSSLKRVFPEMGTLTEKEAEWKQKKERLEDENRDENHVGRNKAFVEMYFVSIKV